MSELFLERQLDVKVDEIVNLSDVLKEILKSTGWSYDVSYKLYGRVRNVFVSDRTHTIGKALEELSDTFGATLKLDFNEKKVFYEISEKENDKFKEVLYVFDKSLLQHLTEVSKEKLIEEGLVKYKDHLEKVVTVIIDAANAGKTSCVYKSYLPSAARFIEEYLVSKGLRVISEEKYSVDTLFRGIDYTQLKISWK